MFRSFREIDIVASGNECTDRFDSYFGKVDVSYIVLDHLKRLLFGLLVEIDFLWILQTTNGGYTVKDPPGEEEVRVWIGGEVVFEVLEDLLD
jgi:hypothetical protein